MAASQILIVMMAAIGLTIIADKKEIQAPLLLAIIGMIVSFVPGIPRTDVAPGIILGLVVPPLLFSAAINFSFFSFMNRLGSIVNLGVLLVAATASAVALLLGSWLAVVSIPAALILGAVIAPTDAVSAISIGGKLGLPNRLMTVLKGESLVNDAAALTMFTLAVSLVTGEKTIISNGILYFLFAAGLGSLLGIAIGVAVHWVRRRLDNPTLVTAITILTPFACYMLAEEMHLSGVMAVVFAGFALGHNATDLRFDGRMQQREVLSLVDSLLEAFVFAYMGLQLRYLLESAVENGTQLWTLAWLSAVTLAAVIAVRVFWVMLCAGLALLRHELRLKTKAVKTRRRVPAEPLDWRENLVLSWAGMRGVVTIAAAAGTPLVTATGAAFPERDLILAIAFGVAIGTLLLQGLTLPWLIRLLRISSARDAAHRQAQFAVAREIIKTAARQRLGELRAGLEDDSDIRATEALMASFEDDSLADPDQKPFTDSLDKGGILSVVREVQVARRAALIAERDAERLDDETLRELLEMMDLEQAFIARRAEARALLTALHDGP